MLRAWKLNLELTLRGLISFFLCIHNGVFIGKQNQYWTCPRHKFSKKNIPSSHCCNALMHCSSKKQYLCLCMYVYIYIYVYMCKDVYANNDIVTILNATDAMWLHKGPRETPSCHWCDSNWNGHAHSNASKASSGRMYYILAEQRLTAGWNKL